MPRRDADLGPVVAKDRVEPGRGQRLASVRAHGNQKQCVAIGFRPLSEQVGLDQPRHIRVQRNPTFLVPLARACQRWDAQ